MEEPYNSLAGICRSATEIARLDPIQRELSVNIVPICCVLSRF